MLLEHEEKNGKLVKTYTYRAEGLKSGEAHDFLKLEFAMNYAKAHSDEEGFKIYKGTIDFTNYTQTFKYLTIVK
jgi:hypothetical protein